VWRVTRPNAKQNQNERHPVSKNLVISSELESAAHGTHAMTHARLGGEINILEDENAFYDKPFLRYILHLITHHRLKIPGVS
jgi:hypothetical protein